MSMRDLTPKELFVRETYIREHPIFDRIRQRARENKCDHMIVAASEARLLQSLMEVHGAKKIVEIGCLYGYSALYFAQGVGERGHVWTLEKSEESAKIAQEFFDESPWGQQIELIVGDARQSLKTLEQKGPFDAVFIDADKTGYVEYLNWAEKNVRKGGLIIADNTFQAGGVWGDKSSNASARQIEVMLEFHKIFSDSNRFKSTIYPSYDGIAVGVRV